MTARDTRDVMPAPPAMRACCVRRRHVAARHAARAAR